jgi:hypothetical protein
MLSDTKSGEFGGAWSECLFSLFFSQAFYDISNECDVLVPQTVYIDTCSLRQAEQIIGGGVEEVCKGNKSL